MNALRHLLREEPVTTVAGSAPDLVVQTALVNRAARGVLARRPWSFLHRDDGYLFFPAAVQVPAGSTALTNGQASGVVVVPLSASEHYADGSLSAKLLVGGDSAFPQTSYRVANIDVGIVTTMTLGSPYRGATGSHAATLYANEAVLPATVARVLSIRNEEGSPVRFETVDGFDDFDRAYPQDSERFSEFPETVAVGGSFLSTSRSTFGTQTVAPAAGVGVRVFPPPSSDVLLRYSYVRRAPALAADADELVGVPDEVQDHVVNWAFYNALYSNIEDDAPRARAARVDLEAEYRALADADRVDVGRRYVPPPFSSRRAPGWRRWTFDRIPEP